jgi:serine/threonine kinase PknH
MEPLSANDPRMIGEFRLRSRLGAGGMGQVYLGFSPAGRAVAIKVIHSQFAADPEFLRRFSHEVKAARAVGGMYTAPVVDSSVTDSSPWLATAYVPGPPLSEIVAEHGPLPEAAVWRLAAGLAEALRAVHAAGVIHRDLKPANVLLADEGPHVIDFGISRPFHGTQLTSAGMVIGTPGYMSPEQAKTGPAGPASDIFSLGCVLTYAATGNPPFGGDNPASVLFRIVSAEPDLSRVPPKLRQVIEACLKKDPAQRPEPAQVIAMISALGPETPATLGSFWPEDVARVIAAEGAAAPPLVERTPTALATPASGAGGSPTGHAPMLSDGYYAAAAQGRSNPAPAPASPSAPLLSSPPQAYAMPQAPPAQPPGGQQSYGQTVFGQPGLGQSGLATPAAYPGQPTAHPGQGVSYPGQGGPYAGQGGPYAGQGGSYPGQQDALAQYAPGRRKPTAAEVPGNVHTAIRLMYAGFVVTALDVVLSLLVLGRYTHDANAANNAAATYTTIREFGRAASQTAIMHSQNTMAGAMAIGLVADLLGLACWAWLAVATRRGNGWTRVAGTALLAIYSICTLIVVFGSHRDPGSQFTTVLVWAIGVATVIPLWSQQARDFFYAWRKR